MVKDILSQIFEFWLIGLSVIAMMSVGILTLKYVLKNWWEDKNN